MTKPSIELIPLKTADRSAFIQALQASFQLAVVETFGAQDDPVISREDIESSLDKTNAEAFFIVSDQECVGGVVVAIDPATQHNSLELLFLNGKSHNKGIGTVAWQAVEQRYPETKIWETITPYFEKRNIHFYVNKCGFKIVEFYNAHHPEPHMPEPAEHNANIGLDECFRFEKVMD